VLARNPNHVYIAAEYDDTPPTIYISQFDYVQDDQFQNSHSEFPVGNNGSLTYGNGVADSIKAGLPYYPVLPEWVLDNNWHDMMLVAYSQAMQPGGDGDCTVGTDDCLTVQFPDGLNSKLKPGLLLLSGSDGDGNPDDIDLIDDTNPGVAPYFEDELGDIFEGANIDNPPDLVFDYRLVNGNDEMLFLE
jgi:hypothetical protein